MVRRNRQGGKPQLTEVPANDEGVVEAVRPTLAGLIALGGDNWCSPEFTAERFPIESDGQDGELVIVHLNPDMTTDKVLVELESRGLKPARIEHLIAYKVKNPADEPNNYAILALGSSSLSSDGRRYFPCLGWYARERWLYLDWRGPDVSWGGGYRFLALRKQVPGLLGS